jgi:hypothetical protein
MRHSLTKNVIQTAKLLQAELNARCRIRTGVVLLAQFLGSLVAARPRDAFSTRNIAYAAVGEAIGTSKGDRRRGLLD